MPSHLFPNKRQCVVSNNRVYLLKFCGLDQIVFCIESSSSAFISVWFLKTTLLYLGDSYHFSSLKTNSDNILRPYSKYPVNILSKQPWISNICVPDSDLVSRWHRQTWPCRQQALSLSFVSVLQLELCVLEIPEPVVEICYCSYSAACNCHILHLSATVSAYFHCAWY